MRKAALFLLLGSCAWPGADWPQWRGPHRDNISRETGLIPEWPAEGPRMLWEVRGAGEGISGLSVAGGRLFVMGFSGDTEYLTALDAATGRPLWSSPVGSSKGKVDNPLMRWLQKRAPTVDGDRVFTFSGDARLTCLRTADGREVWRREYEKDFGAKRFAWGVCDYPLVDGERLICVAGGEAPSMIALDKRTGAVAWRTPAPGAARTSTYAGEWGATVVTEAAGVRQYVAFLRHGVFGFRARDGKLLWSYEKISQSYTQTPLPLGDSLLVTCGHHGAFARLKLLPDGGGVRVEETWLHRRPTLQFTQDSAVVIGDRLYGLEGGQLICIDVETGVRVWGQQLRASSFTWAEGRLYLYHTEGTVTLLEPGPEKGVVRGTFQPAGLKTASGATPPVIAGGRLYLRAEGRLLCFDLRPGGRRLPVERIDLTLPGPGRGPTEVGTAIFVPTPMDIVDEMLRLARVTAEDTVFDLGSGDGRIVIAAAKTHGAKAVGFEIESDLVAISRERAAKAGVADRVRFEYTDMFLANVAEASVVMLYLPEPVLGRLRPKLDALKPGTRIVSHQFRIPGVEPERTVTLDSAEDQASHAIHLWTAPLKK